MSQKNEKLRRQVEGLRQDVAALKLEQTWMQHCISDEQEQRLWAERKKARQARENARQWERLARIWAVSAGVAATVAVLMMVHASTVDAEPDGPEPSPYLSKETAETGRLPGDDTPAREPETAENELIEAALLERAVMIENCTVTHYDICEICCGKTDGITASGVMAAPYVTVAVDPAVIPLGADVLVDYGDGELQYYRADDTGAAVQGNHIDLCVASHEEAARLGKQTATIYWVEQETM